MTGNSSAPRQRRSRGSARFTDRLLAEAARAWEAGRTEPIDDREANAFARRMTPPEFEERVIARAQHLPNAAELSGALTRAGTSLKLVVAGMAFIALVAGALAARASLADHTASIFALLFGLLGVQTLLLALWAVVMVLWRRMPSGGLLGRLVLEIAQRVVARLRRDSHDAAGVEARISSAVTGAAGRWTLAAATHAMWLAFNLGVLLVLAALFLGEGYRFRWDSTWLSAESYGRLIRTVAALPEAVGFAVPTDEDIALSRRFGTTGPLEQRVATRERWAWLFFGSVVVYGFAPRLMLLCVSLVVRKVALARYRLDLDRPEFARLRQQLLPAVSSADRADRPVDGGTAVAEGIAELAEAAVRPLTDPAIVGIEIREPRSGWPPPMEIRVTDLGVIDGRDDEERVLNQLAASSTAPERLLIVCELHATPDRGVGRVVRELRAAVGRPATLLLTAGRETAEAGFSPQTLAGRLDDWRDLAVRSGIDRDAVVEIDLDHLTATTRARLTSLLNPENGQTETGRRLESAMRLIADAALSWREPVPVSDQAEVHRAIAKLYDHARRDWRKLFAGKLSGKIDFGDAKEVAPALQSAAERIAGLLPPALRMNPKWAAAGALAGAFGCVSAASLLFPAAIASLPVWSAIGAAVAGILSTSRAENDRNRDTDEGTTIDEAVRAVALFAVLLELQGRSEASISAILNRVFHDAGDPASNVEVWLDDIRHRFDLALVQEARS